VSNPAPTARFRVVLALSALLQLAVTALPDSMGDLHHYRLWARTLAQHGLAEAYWPSHPPVVGAERIDSHVDYPPVVPYLLLVVGKAGAVFSLGDARLETLIRVPFVLANLALGLLLFVDARRWTAPASATLAATLYLLNPGIIFNTAYWGQSDSVVALFLVASVVALGRGRPEWAWAWFALAALTKPLAYPLAPVLLVATVKTFGWARLARCAAVGAACALVLLLPFAWSGHLRPLLRSLFVQLDAMPYASVNAHNLWWLVERGTPWLDAQKNTLGPVTYEGLGIALFCVFLLVTLSYVWGSRDERGIRLGFASAAFGFFMLATHMHENHSFVALPLLLLVGVDDPRLRRFFLLVSGVLLANMLLHDPYLTHVVRPWVPGPRLHLPMVRGIDRGFFDYFLAQGYPHLVDQIRGETSLVGVVLTVLNAQVATLTFVWWLFTFYGRSSLEETLAKPERPLPKRLVLPAVLLFVGVTSTLFFARAFREDRAGRTSPIKLADRPLAGEQGAKDAALKD
jgi:ALG6, ALG8 glycosyltransferase family